MYGLVFDQSLDIWEGSKGFRKQTLPDPTIVEPADAESVVVKVRYTGVCGSDRGIWFRQSFKDMIFDSLRKEGKTARVIGHEMFGEVVAVGSLVDGKYGFKVGDTVSAESHITCGRCFQCRSGELHVCTEEKIMGISIDGCFAEYVKLPAKVLWLTDQTKIRPEIACMQEPFGNAVHACTKVDLRGKRVAVFGCGPIGLFVVLIARSLGASAIIGVGRGNRNTDLAKACGADMILNVSDTSQKEYPWSHDQDIVDKIKDYTKGVGVDVAFEMAGFNSSVNNAIQSVRRGGDVILFGLKSGNFTLEQFDRMIVRGVTLHSIIGRQIFKTWYITRGLLEDASNGIQEKIWKIIMQEGRGTVVPFSSYDPIHFEEQLMAHPKIVIKF